MKITKLTEVGGVMDIDEINRAAKCFMPEPWLYEVLRVLSEHDEALTELADLRAYKEAAEKQEPVPADKPAVAVPDEKVRRDMITDAIEADCEDAYIRGYNTCRNDVIKLNASPSHSQQSTSVRKFDPCPICGTEKECMGGRSAHPSNWYCPNDRCPSHESEQGGKS